MPEASKISVIIPVCTNSFDAESIIKTMCTQTIGICHMELLFTGNLSNNSNLAYFEKDNPESVGLINTEEVLSLESLIDIAIQYVTSDYLVIYQDNAKISRDSFRALYQASVNSESDITICDVNYNNIEMFTMSPDSDSEKDQIIASKMLGDSIFKRVYKNSFIQKSNLNFSRLLNCDDIRYAATICCLKNDYL